MDELLIELLNMAEKHGILTGGTDDDGNAAYVVIDSGSNITVIVRPGGRAQIIVDGEEESFDISDEEGEGMNNFVESLSQALVEDNLDHKTDKLIKLFEEFVDSIDEESDDEEGDDEDEDSEEDDEEPDDDEEVDLEDDDEVIKEDDEDSEDDKPKKKGKPFGKKKKSMDDESDEEEDSSDEDEEGGDEEAAVEVAHSDIVINNTLLPLGFKVTFDPAINIKGSDPQPNDRYVVIAADTREDTEFVIETPGPLFNAKQGDELLYSGTNAQEAAMAIATRIDPEYAELTENEVAVMIEYADVLINKMIDDAGDDPEVFNLDRVTAELAASGLEGYSIEADGEATVRITAGTDVYNAVPAEFMVSTAAIFASLARNSKNTEVAHKMMRLAAKLGFNGPPNKAIREEAALDRRVELAITQAQLRAEIRKLEVLTVKFQDGEVMLSYTKKAMPDAARREATETPTDMEDALGTAKHMVEWYNRHYAPLHNRGEHS